MNLLSRCVWAGIAVSMLGSGSALAQLGPYEVDEHTVLLMHFDTTGTAELLDNVATVTGAVDGQAMGAIQALPAAFGLGGDFAEALYLQNDTPVDTNHVEVPDYDALDLTGNFTIEGWFQPLAYTSAENGFWCQRHPSIVRKGIGHVLGNFCNYQVAWDGYDHGLYGIGMYTGGFWNSWFEVASDPNVIEIFNWYHFALIRDTTAAAVALLIHDVNGEIVSSNIIEDTNFLNGLVMDVNDYPLYIGSEPNWIDVTPAFYNGYVDEVRISNVARVYEVPIGVTRVIGQNVEPGEIPVVIIQVAAAPGNALAAPPTVHYSTDGGTTFQTVATAAAGEENTYIAGLPTGEFRDQILYYITMENTFGQRTVFPANAEDPTNPDYNGLGFWHREDKTLQLSFEEGAGNPVDSSDYANEVFLRGEGCEYVQDVPPALAGISQYSMAINMNPAAPETCYVDIPRPAMWINGEYQRGWTVDFWAKVHGVTWDERPEGLGQIWLWDGGVSDRENIGDFRIGNYNGPQYWSRIAGGTELQVGIPADHYDFWDKWYHYVQTATADSMFLWVYDENDEMITSGKAPYPAVADILPQNNSYIRLGHCDEPADKLRGYIDEFKFYNYPAIFDVEIGAKGDIAVNGGFDYGAIAWALNNYGANVAEFKVDSTGAMTGDYCAYLNITSVSGTNWELQLSQGFALREGYQYIISYDAKADKDVTIETWLQQNHDPWYAYAAEAVNLTTTAQTFTDTSEVLPTDDTVNLAFILGATAAPCQIWLDNVSVVEVLPTGVEETPGVGLPGRFTLSQNYPNPFNPVTTIDYELPMNDRVTLKVYNLLGRHIATLVDGQKAAGHHQATWDGKDMLGRQVASGIYICQIVTEKGGFELTRKMLLVR